MKRVAIAALALLVLGATAAPSLAQSDKGADLGFIGISASNTEHVRYLDITPSVPFTYYIWAKVDFAQAAVGDATQNATNGIKAWQGFMNVPASLFVLSATLNPGGLNFPAGANDFSVGTGGNLNASGAQGVVLAEISALATIAESDAVISLTESLQPTYTGGPLWQEFLSINGCTNVLTGDAFACFRLFDNVGDMILNNTGVATEETSFGALKADYDE